jgi:hypothetical protein
MDPPKPRPHRKAREKARKEVNNINNTGTKRPREPSAGPTQKARKRRAYHTPTPPPSQGAKDTNAPNKTTPSMKRMPNHSGLIASDDVIYVGDIELQILAEARGVTRKNIPCDVFYSTYLSHFERTDRRPKLDINTIGRVGEGDWEQKLFFRRLCQALPSKVCSGRCFLDLLLTY